MLKLNIKLVTLFKINVIVNQILQLKIIIVCNDTIVDEINERDEGTGAPAAPFPLAIAPLPPANSITCTSLIASNTYCTNIILYTIYYI